MKVFEKKSVKGAIAYCEDFNGASRLLGISRATMSRWMSKYNLNFRHVLNEKFIGESFGRLTILKINYPSDGGRTKALCICKCGTRKEIHLQKIVCKESCSCGCYRKEETIRRSTKHGSVGTPEYRAWMAMKQRCVDPNAWNFKYYGGIGVTVCDAWEDDFLAFFKDMGEKPSSKHSIDRINPYGNYEPGNCRWATSKEQATNKRARNESKKN